MLTKEDLNKAVKNSKNVSDVCRFLGKNPKCSSVHRYIRNKIEEYNINIEHFNRYYNNNVKFTCSNRYVNSVYYKNNKNVKSSILLKKLIKEGIKEEKCENCGNTTWNNEKIPLELHHIDGNHFNNDLDNLMVLCPNCHAQTDNYCGKNIKKHYYCKNCGKEITKDSKSGLCSKCVHESQKHCEWPSKEELIELCSKYSKVKIGKMFGVSDNAVRNWMKHYGII